MYSCDDPYADLDDLIFEKETAAPASADSPSISACLSLFDGARHFSFSNYTIYNIAQFIAEKAQIFGGISTCAELRRMV